MANTTLRRLGRTETVEETPVEVETPEAEAEEVEPEGE